MINYTGDDMRDKLIIALCAILMALAFFSCAKQSGSIVIWHQMQVEERAVLEKLCNEYMAMNPGVKINVLYKETEELRSGFQNAALAGLGPEIIYGPSDQVGPFSRMGIIMPMETLFPPETLSQFDPRGLTYFDGHLYQIGDQIGNHLVLVYNKKLVPNPPQNTDELIDIGKRITRDADGDGRIDCYALVWNYTEPYFFIPFLGGFGGWVMDEQNRPQLNTEATIKALSFLIALRDTHKIIPKECDYDMADALFKEGRAAMIINGPWSWAGYRNAGIDFGITRIPKIMATNKWPTPMMSPRGYSISKNVKPDKLGEVVKLVMYLTSPKSQLAYTKISGTIPSRLDALQDTIVVNNIIISSSRYQLDVCRPMPVVPELRAIWDAMRPSYQAVLAGSLSPTDAAAKMQSEAEKKIKEMYE